MDDLLEEDFAPASTSTRSLTPKTYGRRPKERAHHLPDAVAALSPRLTPEEVASLEELYARILSWASVESRSEFAGGRRGRGSSRHP
jgi:hypothetical protein